MNENSKLVVWVLCFLGAMGLLAFTFMSFPTMKPEHQAKMKLPKSIADVRELGAVMSQYKDEYYFTVLSGFSLVYIFLQTFSIPGSIFLSFLGGTLFGLYVGVPLVCFLSAAGASGAYMMSYLIGRRLVKRFAADKLELFTQKVAEHRDNLGNYFLFLRISPLLPNWFVNIASPIPPVPFHIFFLGTFFGVMPQTLIAVKAGLTLQEINDVRDVLDVRFFLTLVLLSFGTLIPTLKPVQRFLDRVLNRRPAKANMKSD